MKNRGQSICSTPHKVIPFIVAFALFVLFLSPGGRSTSLLGNEARPLRGVRICPAGGVDPTMGTKYANQNQGSNPPKTNATQTHCNQTRPLT